MNLESKKSKISKKVLCKTYLLAVFALSNSLALSQEIKIEKKKVCEKIIENLEHEKKESSEIGKFGITGNAVGIRETVATIENEGKIKGKIVATGKDNKDDEDRRGAIILEGQGNGIASIAYSPLSNKRDLDKNIESVKNGGFIGGEVDLKGGNALQNGEVSTTAAGNGILAYAIADYGEVVGAEGGDTGLAVDTVAGGSRSKSVIRPRRRISKADLIIPESGETKSKEIDLTRKPDPADWNGKDVVTKISFIANKGIIEGKVKSKSVDGYSRGMSPIPELNGAEGLDPQWRSQKINSSGNAVSATTYVLTPTKHTFAEEKQNRAIIGDINNTGKMKGEVDVQAGSGGTITYSHATGSGNGVSAMAYTSLFAKNKTSASVGKVRNSGEISGDVKLLAGNNSGQGYHEYSDAKSSGSGNGISTYIDASNYNIKEAYSKIGDVTNVGAIKGKILAKAGAGNGSNIASVESSGNGISAYGRAARKEVEIGSVDNKGVISGNSIVYGGKDTKGLAKNVEDKLFVLPLDVRAEEKIEDIKSDFGISGRKKFDIESRKNPVTNIETARRNKTLENTYKADAIKDIERIETVYGGKGSLNSDDKLKLYLALYDNFNDKKSAEKIKVTDPFLKLTKSSVNSAKSDILAKVSELKSTKNIVDEIIKKNGKESLGNGFDYMLKSFNVAYNRDLSILDEKLNEAKSLLVKLENEETIKSNNKKKEEFINSMEIEKDKIAKRDKEVKNLNLEISEKKGVINNLNGVISDLESNDSNRITSKITELTSNFTDKNNKLKTVEEEEITTKELNDYQKLLETKGYKRDFNDIVEYKNLMAQITKDKIDSKLSDEKNVEELNSILKKIKKSGIVGYNDKTKFNKELKNLEKTNPVQARVYKAEYLEVVIASNAKRNMFRIGITEEKVKEILDNYNELVKTKTVEIVKLKEELDSLKEIVNSLKAATSKENTITEVSKLKGKIASVQNEITKKESKITELNNMKNNIASLSKDIEALEKENAELAKNIVPKNDSRGLIDDTIQTTTYIYGSGNGISIYQEGEVGNKLGDITNEGVISGYSEVHHGYGQGDYTNVVYYQGGAGISVRSNLDSSITNAGIISGNNFALLSKGKLDDSQSIFEPEYKSGFEGGVENYGILAGRAIIGGYRLSGLAAESAEYFETIFADKDKYNNYGIFIKLDENGNPSKVYTDESKQGSSYKFREVINVAGLNDSYATTEDKLSSKIVNGVGTNGVINIGEDSEFTVENSIINGYRNSIKLEDGATVNLKRVALNSNGFTNSNAILGSEGKNKVIIDHNSTINGKIDLSGGDDTLVIKGNSQFNSTVDLGSGINKLVIEKASPARRVRRRASIEPSEVVITGEINNANNIEIKTDTRLTALSRFNNVDNIKVEDGNKLVYEFVDKEHQPFATMVSNSTIPEIVIDAKDGEFEIEPVGEYFALGDSKDVLNINFVLKDEDGGSEEGEIEIINPDVTQPTTDLIVVPEIPETTPTEGTAVESEKEVTEPTTDLIVVPETPETTPTEGTAVDDKKTVFVVDKKVEKLVSDSKGTDKDITGIYAALKNSIKKGEVKLEQLFGKIKKMEAKTLMEKIVYKNRTSNTKVAALTLEADNLKEIMPNDNLDKNEMQGKAIVQSNKENFKNGSENSIDTRYAKFEYGLGNGKTVGFNLGGGKFKNTAFSNNSSSDMFGVATSLTHRLDNFEYTVGLSMNKIDGNSEIQKLKGYGAYVESKYNIAIDENWSITPKVNISAIKYKQDELKQDPIVLNSSKGTYKEVGTGVEISRKGYVGNGTLNLNVAYEYDIRRGNKSEVMARFKGASENFKIHSEKLKNKSVAQVGVGYNHVSGIFAKATMKFNLDNKKDKRVSTTIGYKF